MVIALWALIIAVVFLILRMIRVEWRQAQLFRWCRRLEHEVKVTRAGRVLPVDTSDVPGAVGMQPTPAPLGTAYQDYVDKRGAS